MNTRSLEDIAEPTPSRRISFSALMPWRVRNILLVSSLYDSFIFQEEGHLGEMLVSEYLDLNLSYAPAIERVSTAEDAIRRVGESRFDLVISMPRIGGMDVLEFSRRMKAIASALPVVILAYDAHELGQLQTRAGLDAVDRIFLWQGDARLMLAMIKLVEDRANAAHDAEAAGVKSILLVEDSVRFISAYLPLLYTEIVKQTQELMADGVTRMEQLLRMRARPKILLATTFEEGQALFERHRDHILGVIADARFPREGRVDAGAGAAFLRIVRAADPMIPVLMQSSEAVNEAAAVAVGAGFIDKNSETLLHKLRDFLRTYLGFGDFLFRRPDGSLIATARNLPALVDRLRTIPDDSLLYHAARNDFSTWLMARTEFDCARALRPRTCDEFASADALRAYLLEVLEAQVDRSQAGLVARFSPSTFRGGNAFTRIGNGSLGGKGRGLAFFHSLLDGYAIANRIPGVCITVPSTAVLATDIFERFMESSRLSVLALQAEDESKVRAAFLAAELPEETRLALRSFLEQVRYPIAVRSSSLLEDSSHQPFAGIYETYMLPNRDPDLDIRLEALSRAIRLVYASTYSANARSYIESTPHRLEEEKMAVVIQRIAARPHGSHLYPDVAGVFRTFNHYPVEGMQAADGIASVALGLGRTVVQGGRCVRFSPAAPQRLYQFSSTAETLANAQRSFFALDLDRPAPSPKPEEDNIVSLDLETAASHGTLDPVGSVYSPENDVVYEGVHRPGIKLVTMAGLLSGRAFPLPDVLAFLGEVGKAGFGCDVEIEFAVVLHPGADAGGAHAGPCGGKAQLGLNGDGAQPERTRGMLQAAGGRQEFAFLQVRPLVPGSAVEDLEVEGFDPRRAICVSGGALGHGRQSLADLVYVRAQNFDRARTRDIAGEVGRANARLREAGRSYILIGPGRWGSADPWLGIPVAWAQISHARCIVEDEMQDMKVAPSQGTHFFQNITSLGIGYFTLDSCDPHAHLDRAWLEAQPAAWESEHVRHLAFDRPLQVTVDGRRGLGVILKPE